MFFAESSEHWTLLYMTTSTLHMLSYSSVIDLFRKEAVDLALFRVWY
jgi:hypothetical protein